MRLKDSLYERGRAIQDYSSPDDSFSFSTGDILFIHDRRDNGRCQGELVHSGRHGVFPLSFVQIEETPFFNFAYQSDGTPKDSEIIHDSVEGAKEVLGQVDRQEKISKLTKFFGTTPVEDMLKGGTSPPSKESHLHLLMKGKDKKNKKSKKKPRERELEQAAKEWEEKYLEVKERLMRTEKTNSNLRREVAKLKSQLGNRIAN